MLLGSITVLSLIIALGAGICAGGLAWLWVAPLTFLGAWVGLGLLAFLFLWIASALVDTSKVQEEDDKFYRFLVDLYVPALIGLVLVDVKATGLEKTPREGRFMLVCNHLFLADPGILLACFRDSQLAFISKQENLDMFIIGKLMHKILCQTLDRDNDRQALRTILKCIQLIKEDKVSVGVFPEGGTSKDNKLHHFRAGAFKIAQKADVPIVVCTIQNTRQIFKNLKKLKRTTVELHLVEVLPAQELKGKTTVEIADRVYGIMLSDLGPAYAPAEENT